MYAEVFLVTAFPSPQVSLSESPQNLVRVVRDLSSRVEHRVLAPARHRPRPILSTANTQRVAPRRHLAHRRLSPVARAGRFGSRMNTRQRCQLAQCVWHMRQRLQNSSVVDAATIPFSTWYCWSQRSVGSSNGSVWRSVPSQTLPSTTTITGGLQRSRQRRRSLPASICSLSSLTFDGVPSARRPTHSTLWEQQDWRERCVQRPRRET